MAGLAIIHDTEMIKSRWFKTRSQVADAAIIIGWYVVAVFSHRDNTIVA